ncbi:hypothetical protein AtubIFM57143_002524 [Aspergillus tubingensis]|nr:hypothetical protein AtubIFM57143_002524 [Aspergillus tubingensis]
MVAANRAGAARSGFIHKYPTAYEGPKATIDHENVAIDQIRSARKFRKITGRDTAKYPTSVPNSQPSFFGELQQQSDEKFDPEC